MQNAFIQKMDRLRDLYKKWGLKTAKLKQLNAKAGELQPRSDLTPPLLRRLSRWVEQIAGMEAKERDVISEITAIEEKHLAMRKSGHLRRAAPKAEPMPEPTRDQKRSNLWFWLLLLWMMRSGRKPSLSLTMK